MKFPGASTALAVSIQTFHVEGVITQGRRRAPSSVVNIRRPKAKTMARCVLLSSGVIILALMLLDAQVYHVYAYLNAGTFAAEDVVRNACNYSLQGWVGCVSTSRATVLTSATSTVLLCRP
jgi:hypothetical protein